MTIRARGRVELVRELERRGFKRSAARSAAARVEAEGWLNDAGAARALVRSRKKRYGRARVERELSVRGFSPEVASEVLAAEMPEGEEGALGRAFQRLWRSHAGLPGWQRRRKVRAALSRRGFAARAISAMMKDAHEID